MMSYVENVFEKEERVKQLWNKYGNHVVSVIVVIMLSIVGLQYWHKHQVKVNAQASVAYENLLSSAVAKKNTEVEDLSQQLISDYSGTVYAKLAGLLYAKQAAENKQYAAAEEKLQWVVRKASSASFKAIAQVRLARVLIADNKAEQAVTVANAISPTEFQAEANMIKGDAYFSLKNVASAKQSYQAALKAATINTPLYTLIQMKLYSLK